MNKRSFLNQAIFGDFFVVTGDTQITSATTINFKVSTEGTTYVKNINILDIPISGNSTDSILVRDSGGIVKIIPQSSISGVDNYVTGGTFDSITNTLTLDRQNGSVSITGFTPGGVTSDNYVTGGTFNSGTGTLTLDRQNGSVNVTGFTTGTGSDTYVTGFTYNNFNGELTISQNQGQPPLSVTVSTISSISLFNYYNFI